jgi:isoamylase/glycogen operon protein
MHVDGVRFDLASILCRGANGEPLKNPPLIEEVSQDPVLSKVKLIAEPWDPGGLYQVGSFFMLGAGHEWSEWNGRYRDTFRHYLRGSGAKGEFITYLCGSENLYHSGSPCCSINFVTAHDGFSLADLVSYTRKHNFGNGEENRDGDNNNESWNCGIEGPTSKSTVVALRQRQMRNIHLAMMISRGIPMLLMGNEYGHTKQGNNNTWCQDNEFNWFLWNELEANEDFYRFYRGLIHLRHQHSILRQNRFLMAADIDWHGRKLFMPDWNPADPVVAFTIKDPEQSQHIYVAFNAGPQAVEIELPIKDPTSPSWRWVVNTGQPSPKDFVGDEEVVPVTTPECEMQPFSAVMLIAMR